MSDEEFSNKILGIFVFFMYTFIALLVLFVIGICRVEAASSIFGWNSQGTIKQCNNANYCYFSDKIPTGYELLFDQYIGASTKVDFYVDIDFNYLHTSDVVVNMNNPSVFVRNGSGLTPDITSSCNIQNSTINRFEFTEGGVDYYSKLFSYRITCSRSFQSSYNSILIDFSKSNTNVNGISTLTIHEYGLHFNSAVDSDSINSSIENGTSNIINNQNNNTQIIIDSITDGELEDNTQPDDSKLNDYEDAENNLIDRDSLNNINNIEISLDSNSNTFIWNLVDRIINTHTLIFGLIITMLSLGIIKLVLNR